MAKSGWTEDDLKRKGYHKSEEGIFIPKSAAEIILSETSSDHRVYYKQVIDETEIKSGHIMAIFDIVPVGAPRMTRSDKWKTDPHHKDPKKQQRKPVTQYFRFRSDIQAQALKIGFTLPESGFHVIFYLPMPHSWSGKKKSQMKNSPHQQKPDADNLIKAVKDSLCESDAYIWDYRITKYWGESGKIIIYKL